MLRWMRTQPQLAEVPVAVISARPQASGAEVARNFRDHVIEVLEKPFDIHHVLRLIEDHCEPEQPAA